MIVIGAGLAGLCAAYELHGLGYDVKVYEARPRVGGRVHSLDDFVNGKIAEGGGELIGSNHPLWNSYKHHFGLSFTDVKEYGNSPFRLKGETLTADQSKDLIDQMEEHPAALDMAEEAVAEAGTLMGALDQAGNIGEDELAARPGDDTEIGVKGGERIVGDLWFRCRNGREKR